VYGSVLALLSLPLWLAERQLAKAALSILLNDTAIPKTVKPWESPGGAVGLSKQN
jgi:hypothetical protein